ncbi:hypothetical protein [Novosphingobium sp. HII-3]|uniref:hypothetical protein n=1 Tax=Novosphingobium sp. HII-3 TaxID=2075565 RepID=UPI000CDAD16C|nr:hypothetical protein [Novosphingobium sp. HII-3]
MPHDLPASAFPPSFEGNPWAFFFALFSLSLIVLLSLAQILRHMCEAGRDRALMRKFGEGFRLARPHSFWTTAVLYRWKVSGLYLTVLFGAVGDVAVMLAWREVRPLTMEILLQMDRILDGLTIIPFMAAVALAAWSDQAIPAQLTFPKPQPVNPPKWERIKGSVRIVATIALIALGVTMGKASL